MSAKVPPLCYIHVTKPIGLLSYLLQSCDSGNKIPLRKDYSIVIQAQFVNPNKLFFRKDGTSPCIYNHSARFCSILHYLSSKNNLKNE